MKILFVSPDSPDTFWGLKNALRFISKKATLPPLGLLTVAEMVPEDWDKKLVDMATAKLRDRDIQWADYVFISAMSIQEESTRQVINKCKEVGTKVVAGGTLFTSLPEDYKDVDHLILNEAEITLPQFLTDLQKGRPKNIYKSNRFANMNDTPVPPWELIKSSHYASMSIQYSRGCPFNCDFCDVTNLFGHKIRTKTKNQLLQEMEGLYSTGWRGQVFIVDDNFIANKQKLKNEILPAMIDWTEKKKYPFYFNTQCSIDLADDEELMQLMVKAGFDCVFIGIETPAEESLFECNKVQNRNRDMVECIKKIQRFGMQVQAGFILGFDSDKASVFEDLIRFIQQSGVVTAMVGLLNAPRGTKLYRRLKNEKRLLKNTIGRNTDSSINFITKMNLEDLLKGYQKVIRTIYSNKYYYERIFTFLRNFDTFQRTKVKFYYHRDIKAFFKSIWSIGILSKDKMYYWKVLLWSIRHPKHFRLAITLAVYGFHFHKMFENYASI
jgi:radical SAM superfamily enzyme YgiQ (UPF0313 family)